MSEASASNKNVSVASGWVRHGRGANDDDEAALCSVLTLVIWAGCISIGVMGLALPYAPPKVPAADCPAIRAERLDVQLSSTPPSISTTVIPSAVPASSLPPMLLKVPAVPVAASISKPPPLATLAIPAATFILPVYAPAKVGAAIEEKQDAKRSEGVEPGIRGVLESKKQPGQPNASSDAPMTPAQPPAQALTFGQGEGRQVAPEYPLLAVRTGQEGTVRIRFQVDEAGCVTGVNVIEPSPWPLLNEAALRTISRRWRFAPGIKRLYEVPIHFQLKK